MDREEQSRRDSHPDIWRRYGFTIWMTLVGLTTIIVLGADKIIAIIHALQGR